MRASVFLAAVAGLGLAACGRDAPTSEAPRSVAARVGDHVLTEANLARALGDEPADSAEARRAFIEAFVRRSLLVDAATEQGVDDDPEVAWQLAEARRAVLEQAALDRLLTGAEATAEQIQAYYAANPGAFTTTEPAVRIRHLRLGGADAAARGAQAAQTLARVTAGPNPDSTFALAARELSDDPAGSVALARQFLPLSRLAEIDPLLGRAVSGLSERSPAAVVPSGSVVHVVQLAERLPAGTVLPLRAVRAQIAERLGVGLRTEAAARLVERLRAEATARGDLD